MKWGKMNGIDASDDEGWERLDRGSGSGWRNGCGNRWISVLEEDIAIRMSERSVKEKLKEEWTGYQHRT